MTFLQKALLWLTENYYNYMIPLCMLCVLRVAVCLLELKHMKRLRDKKFVFRSVGNHYKEIGLFIGLFIGFVAACALPLKLVWIVAAIVLAAIGFKVGAKKGAEADDFWRQVIEEIKASEEAELLAQAPDVGRDVGALLDNLDIYDDDEKEKAVEAEAAPVAEEEATEEKEEA